jgi:hypothetical protein
MTTRYEDYGRMERELAFKLLAAHAMVDKDFFERLRRDPRAAAEHLHIALTDADVEYIQGIGWETIERSAESVRESLHLELVTNSW